MANVLLSAKGIKIRFGGVIAADGIDLDVYGGEESRHHRPQWRGQDDVSEYLHRLSSGRGRLSNGSRTRKLLRIHRARSRGSALRALFRSRNCSLEQTVLENMLLAAASSEMAALKSFRSLPDAAE